jgi:hypothetical protein
MMETLHFQVIQYGSHTAWEQLGGCGQEQLEELSSLFQSI